MSDSTKATFRIVKPCSREFFADDPRIRHSDDIGIVSLDAPDDQTAAQRVREFLADLLKTGWEVQP